MAQLYENISRTFKCAGNMLPTRVGKFARCAQNIPTNLDSGLNVQENSIHEAEFAGFVGFATHVGNMVPAHLRKCRKYYHNVVPPFQTFAVT